MDYIRALSLGAALAITAGGLVLVTGPVSARGPVVVTAPSPDTVTRRIPYGDLNLASVAGERTLRHRVGTAVVDLCEEVTGGPFGYVGWSMMDKCNSDAWRQARPQIRRAVHRARDLASTGTSPIAATAITIATPK